MSNKFKYPNQGEMLIGIVVGGDSEDPAPDKAGGFRVWLPGLYNPKKIQFTDLPFARMLTQSTQDGVQSFNPPPERGSVVLVQKDGGPGHPATGHVTVMGVLPNTIMKGLGVPGATSLSQFFMDAVNHQTDKKAPPKSLKTSTRDGAEIREVEDNGMWSQALVKSIPATATLWPMSGIPLPAVRSVSTAIQHSTGILDGNILGALPGSAMSLGTLFSKLQATGLVNQITAQLDPEIQDAFASITSLITQVELTSSYGFAVGGRVHEATFLQNAVQILSLAKSVGDLVDGMNRLTSDDSLFGTENLEPVKIRTSTPYGNTSVTVDSEGNVKATINISAITANTANANVNTSNAVANTANTRPKTDEEKEDDNFIQNIRSFLGMMTSAEQAFSASGKNMFGNSAPMMFDVFNRLNPGGTAHMKQLVETVNTGSKEQNKLKPLAEKAFRGGKILSDRGFS